VRYSVPATRCAENAIFHHCDKPADFGMHVVEETEEKRCNVIHVAQTELE
jgi:hypothetical protein